ncbi:GAF and ANTAR domain-containing protein [Streptomyces gobiensis]|uniref:GAF and ANTAR domain-containing protein n=1 Tax=Streptomyces gobiensis TaxID=2875706 RepID=UPI001E619626|nr:ANTAR domain-containing protein [Streptomyces gobiensis]UGY93052.1 ANTAR domain-containing protein [Streptomyces gobiensis]
MSKLATVSSGASEEARLAAVRRYEILDTPPDGAFDRVAALAARFVDTPMATVTIVDEDRIWFKAAHGLSGASEIGRDPGLCASAVLQDEPYLLPDTLKDPEAAANPLVTGELGLRFYAAAPIVTADGYRLGTVNVLGTEPRPIAPREADTLRDLASVVTDELELRLASMHAVQLERELRASQEAEMRTAMESHAAIDQAMGILMKAQRCDAAAAWDILKRISQNTNTKIRVLAEATTGLATGVSTVPVESTVEAPLRRALRPLPRGRS